MMDTKPHRMILDCGRPWRYVLLSFSLACVAMMALAELIVDNRESLLALRFIGICSILWLAYINIWVWRAQVVVDKSGIVCRWILRTQSIEWDSISEIRRHDPYQGRVSIIRACSDNRIRVPEVCDRIYEVLLEQAALFAPQIAKKLADERSGGSEPYSQGNRPAKP